MHVRAAVRRQPVRRQQAVDKRLQAIGLADDHLRVFDQLRAIELALEQLRGAPYAAERILDLMGEAADQFAICLLLFEQAFLARNFQLLIDVPELEREREIVALDRRHRASQVKLCLPCNVEL